MAITTSLGYEGTIDYADLTKWIPYVGAGRYGVVDAGWRPSPGTGDRGVRIGIGWGWGYGVIDGNSTNVNINLDPVVSGQRWDMIVAHRDWTAKLTTFEVIEGSSTKTLPARANAPADEDDQPIALCRVVAGSSVVSEIVDLRVWRGGFAMSAFVREYYDEIGASLRIGDSISERVYDPTYSPRWDVRAVHDGAYVDILHMVTAENASGVYRLSYAPVVGGVVLRGGSKKKVGVWAVGDVIATLPNLASPAITQRFVVPTATPGQAAKLRITSTGAVVFDELITTSDTSGPSWIQLDGILISR